MNELEQLLKLLKGGVSAENAEAINEEVSKLLPAIEELIKTIPTLQNILDKLDGAPADDEESPEDVFADNGEEE